MRTISSILIIISTCIVILSLSYSIISGSENNKMPSKSIEEVLEEHTKGLMSIEGVTGTAEGLCNGQPCIMVYVVKKTEQLIRQIPSSLEGYPVEIEETGVFKALPEYNN